MCLFLFLLTWKPVFDSSVISSNFLSFCLFILRKHIAFPWLSLEFHDFPGVQIEIINSMIFQVFHDLYKPSFDYNVQTAYFNHTDSIEHGMVLYDQNLRTMFYLNFPEENSWFHSFFGKMPLPCILIVKRVIQGRIFNKPNWNLNRIENHFIIHL